MSRKIESLSNAFNRLQVSYSSARATQAVDLQKILDQSEHRPVCPGRDEVAKDMDSLYLSWLLYPVSSRHDGCPRAAHIALLLRLCFVGEKQEKGDPCFGVFMANHYKPQRH